MTSKSQCEVKCLQTKTKTKYIKTLEAIETVGDDGEEEEKTRFLVHN